MRKSTIIIIAIIYIASIVAISMFGLRAKIFKEVIPVTSVECVNTTDEKTIVEEMNGKTIINIKYDGPGDPVTLQGTMVQLYYRVLPDNASNKRVKYVYNDTLTRLQFVTDENGNQLGLILFSGIGIFNIRIMATDGSPHYADVVINVHP